MNFSSLRRRPSCVLSAININLDEDKKGTEEKNERATILGQVTDNISFL